MAKAIIKLLITGAILIVIVLSEMLYNGYLFQKSLKIIVKLQQANIDYLNVWKIISESSLICAVVLFVLSIIYLPFKYSTHYFLTIQLAFYVMYTLKNVYHNFRPYWVDGNIKAVDTSLDFGNPSGHTLTVATTFLGFCKTLYNCHKSKGQSYKALHIGLLLFSIATIAVVIMSRLICGAHSINQVLYGLIASIGIIYISYFLWESEILEYIENTQMMCTKCVCNIWLSLVVFSLVVINEILIYVVYNNKIELTDIILQEIKIHKPNADQNYPLHDGFVNSASSVLFLGQAIGVFIERFVFNIDCELMRNDISKFKLFLIGIIKLVVALALVAVAYLVMPENMWLSFVILCIIGNLVTLFIFGFSNKMMVLFKLQKSVISTGIRSQLLDQQARKDGEKF